ncbi:MAG: ABC transporter permease [Alphaproteobacteria bacterium]|nr:ABC transporter permease [Alphaproteobacteria bacterium]
MTFASVVAQLLNGLAGASSLFMVAAGLSLIFGVTRIVNFAHGSLYMLGLYGGYSLLEGLQTSLLSFGGFGRSPLGFWAAVVIAALLVGVAGVLIEVLVLRRIYRAPELFQLLATFAVVLVVKDIALAVWGAEDLVGPRAPGLSGTVDILGRHVPQYDLALIVIAPVVLLGLWLALARTRWGALVRAATQDREMVGALGVNEAWLFTGVFFVGAMLAGLGGALQLPREPAHLGLDLALIADAFVVTVVGGLGSVPGAFLAAILIGVVKAFCVALGTREWLGIEISFSRLTLVVEFLVMAAVLIARPYGLLGRPPAVQRAATEPAPPLSPPRWQVWAPALVLLALVPLALPGDRYLLVLLTDIIIFALFAVSLHVLMGPSGMVSFGHAAYFGIAAYAAALLLKRAAVPMEATLLMAPIVAGGLALLFGWFCVRLSGVYLAMLTLAFAQIAWSVIYQWGSLTGGSNGMIGVWPPSWLASKSAYYWLALALCALGIAFLWRVLFSPFGYALRAGRDSSLRVEAIGIDLRRQQWLAFALAGALAGLAGALFAFSKGSISPELSSIAQSTDALVMVLLGGVETLTGPVAGAAVFTWLKDELARRTEFWRALLGLVILALVLSFPQGIAGGARQLWDRLRQRGVAT